MMKAVNLRVCLSVISFMGLGLFVPETKAAGPAVAQQAMTQIQSKLTEASVGWRHWHRGWGWGGYGGWGYGGWGGYRRIGFYGGYGGYYGGYGGYGGYAYPGYSYSYVRVRPRFYSAYTYASPYMYSSPYSYSYASPSYCCGNSTYPSAYGVSNYSYGTQPLYAASSYATPVYSSPSGYGTSTYSYGNAVYTPSTTAPTVISSPVVYPTSNSSQAPAPYPAPPVEIQQPSAYQAPMATLPKIAAYDAYPAPVPESAIATVVPLSNSAYSPNFAYTGVSRATPNASPSYSAYQPTVYRPSTVSALSRLSAGIVW